MKPFTILNWINKSSLILALFLVPIFFLPFTQNVLDFPKQFLLSFLVLVSLISWLAKQVLQEKILFLKNKLFYFSLILIFLVFLFSTVFSVWDEASFWGWPLSVSDGLVTFFIFLTFAFLVANSFDRKNDYLLVLFSLFLFLLSAALAGLFTLLQLYQVFILPFDFSQIPSFNTVGIVNSIAILAVALFPLALVLLFKTKSFWRVAFGLIALILFADIVLINLKSIWLLLIIAIFILLVFNNKEAKKKINFSWQGCLMLALVFAIFFMFFPLTPSGFPDLPLDVSPSFASEINILKGVFSEGIKNITFGTGPGTFVFDYSKYHSPLLNQTIFWGTRFSSGDSVFLDWLITKGVLAGIALIFLQALLVYFVIKNLGKTERKENFEIKLGISSSLFVLIVAGFLYAFNFVIWFSFWALIGLFLFFFTEEHYQIDLISSTKKLFANFLLIATTIIGLSLFFIMGQSYVAEAYYLSGMENYQKGNVDEAINNVKKSIQLNSSIDFYWRDLAQLYLTKANLISQDSSLSLEEKRAQSQEVISQGVNSLNRAISIVPINVANWNVRGFFYRNLIGIQGAGELSLGSYRRAAELEPASPFAFGEMGKVYILLAQDFKEKGMEDAKQESLSLAVKSLEKAIELKPDYAQVRYLLAVAYDQKGEKEEAITKLEDTKKITPRDAGIAFQLGVLYWRNQQINEAETELERAINLKPDYSNAKYVLGLVYDQKGEKEKARAQFEELLRLNPDNEEVKTILSNLKQGLPALSGITSTQPPFQESPPEIQE